MMKARRMVKLSYENEVKRQKQSKFEMEKKEREVREALEQAQNEFKRIENKELSKHKKSQSNSNLRKQKPKSKSRGPFEHVKSRLHQSIESSRLKE